jgi:hypothetical protein
MFTNSKKLTVGPIGYWWNIGQKQRRLNTLL